MQYTIGIMGSAGFVGSAIKKYFETVGAPLRVYDKFKNEGSIEQIQEADVVFIAVPTPYEEEKGGFDLSFVESAIEALQGSKIIIIKSTVLPGTTESFQTKFPQHRFLFNPEFLTQVTAQNDMQFPDRQIMGYTKESYTVAKDILRLLPLAPFERIIPATEAEMVKYFNNTWFATKVVFANQIYDLCGALGIDYENVRDCAAADKRVGPSHLIVNHGGYRGYGGACLPKDTRALIQLGNRLNTPMDLLKQVETINNDLRAKEQALPEEKVVRATDNHHTPPSLFDNFEMHTTANRGV